MRRIILVGCLIATMTLIPVTYAQEPNRDASLGMLGALSIVISLAALALTAGLLLVTLFAYYRLSRRANSQSNQIERLQKAYDNLWWQFQSHVESPTIQNIARIQESLDQFKIQQKEFDDRIAQQRQETSDTILAMTLLPLGERLYNAKDLAGAIDTYKRALSLNNKSPVIHYRLGYIHAQRGDLEDAEGYLQNALDIDPAYAPAVATLGYVYRRKGEVLPTGNQRETYLLKAEGRLLEALEHTPRLLDEEGESWWCNLGALYRQRGQFKKAIDAYREAARITPSSPYPLSNIALYQGVNGDIDAMIKTYREVERLARQRVLANPDDYWPHADLLVARLTAGKIQEAEETLRTLLKLVPRDLAYAVPGLLVTLSRLSKLLPDNADHIDKVSRFVREYMVEGRGPIDEEISLESQTFVVAFEEVPALGIRVANHDDPVRITRLLDLTEPRPSIFILGGAMDMASEEMQATRPIIEQALAPFAQEMGIAIVDGGTCSGVMRLMGEARVKNRGTFPLIGIAPVNLVKYPGYENPNGYDLDPGHSHFVLTSEGDWGDETDMITQLAYALTGMGKWPGLGLVINGGSIVRQEVYRLTVTERLRFPLLALEGSGRFADTLAKAIRDGASDDEELQAIVDRDLIELVSVAIGPQGVRAKLESYLKST